MPLNKWIKELYLELLEAGWKLEEIDEMEIGWYFDLTNYEEEKEDRKRVEALDNAGL